MLLQALDCSPKTSFTVNNVNCLNILLQICEIKLLIIPARQVYVLDAPENIAELVPNTAQSHTCMVPVSGTVGLHTSISRSIDKVWP